MGKKTLVVIFSIISAWAIIGTYFWLQNYKSHSGGNFSGIDAHYGLMDSEHKDCTEWKNLCVGDTAIYSLLDSDCKTCIITKIVRRPEVMDDLIGAKVLESGECIQASEHWFYHSEYSPPSKNEPSPPTEDTIEPIQSYPEIVAR